MAVPYWADQLIVEHPADEIIINDSKTYSGSAHVGSLRGPVIHDVILRAGLTAGRTGKFYYGSDDYDALEAAALAAWRRAVLDAPLMQTVCAAPYLDRATSE